MLGSVICQCNFIDYPPIEYQNGLSFDLNSDVTSISLPFISFLFNYHFILQRANLTNHLLKVRSDIKESIPNPDFDGLAIIDYEKWRPIWEHNWYTKRIYQNESVAYVKERYKNITEKYAKLIAENEFNNAAM